MALKHFRTIYQLLNDPQNIKKKMLMDGAIDEKEFFALWKNTHIWCRQ